MIGQGIRFLLGILLIPAVVAISRAFYFELISNIEAATNNALYLMWGAMTYLAARVVFEKLDYLYIFGHEFTHAIATILSGGKVRSMKISEKAGSVTTTKTNTFIELSPYLMPFYTLFLALAWFIASFFMDVSGYTSTFLFFIGFTMALHLSSTVTVLKTRQADLLAIGHLLSIVIIYIVNIIIVGVVLGLLFPSLSLPNFFTSFWNETAATYTAIYRQLFVLEETPS